MAWSLTDWALMMIWKRTATTRPLDDERLCDIDASSDSRIIHVKLLIKYLTWYDMQYIQLYVVPVTQSGFVSMYMAFES